MSYRLVSIYYSPEYTTYVLQCRLSDDHPWQTLPTLSSQALSREEQAELRKAFGG